MRVLIGIAVACAVVFAVLLRLVVLCRRGWRQQAWLDELFSDGDPNPDWDHCCDGCGGRVYWAGNCYLCHQCGNSMGIT